MQIVKAWMDATACARTKAAYAESTAKVNGKIRMRGLHVKGRAERDGKEGE